MSLRSDKLTEKSWMEPYDVGSHRRGDWNVRPEMEKNLSKYDVISKCSIFPQKMFQK